VRNEVVIKNEKDQALGLSIGGRDEGEKREYDHHHDDNRRPISLVDHHREKDSNILPRVVFACSAPTANSNTVLQYWDTFRDVHSSSFSDSDLSAVGNNSSYNSSTGYTDSHHLISSDGARGDMIPTDDSGVVANDRPKSSLPSSQREHLPLHMGTPSHGKVAYCAEILFGACSTSRGSSHHKSGTSSIGEATKGKKQLEFAINFSFKYFGLLFCVS
jgi:hypothetical protein